MNQLITTAAQPATMSSREIAELTKKDHANVLRDARIMLTELGIDAIIFEGIYFDAYGREQPCLHLPKDLTLTLVAGYNVKMRHAIVVRWQELEAMQLPSPPPAELSRMDILKLAMDSEEARIKAEAERDEAIRTKALIGSKREATAMATASSKAKEVAKLKHELGRNQLHATVKAVKKMTGTEYCWRKLKKHCADNGLEARNVADEQYGIVKAWPATAWRDVHGIDLSQLFPQPE